MFTLVHCQYKRSPYKNRKYLAISAISSRLFLPFPGALSPIPTLQAAQPCNANVSAMQNQYHSKPRPDFCLRHTSRGHPEDLFEDVFLNGVANRLQWIPEYNDR